MTRQQARAYLVQAFDHLWGAVGELVLITVEDVPGPPGLAVADDLIDSVTGLQGEVAACRELIAAIPAELSTRTLAPVHEQLVAAALRYWRSVRAWEPVSELRQGTRSRSAEWTAWADSVLASAARCEAPLLAADASCQAAWTELIEATEPVPHGQETTHLRRTL
jgi:hypothetical protein